MAVGRRFCFATTAVAVGVAALRWPWKGIDFKRHGLVILPEHPKVQEGWLLAPFGAGLFNRFFGGALLAQFVPLAPAQRFACVLLTPNPSDPQQQIYSGFYLNGLDTAAWALRTFPDSRELQSACIKQSAMTSLFNQYGSNASGNAGFVDLSMAAFRRFKTDPSFQQLGDLGCFFDYSPRNVRHWTDIGGIAFVHEMIKTHYNDMMVMFHAFCAYSSGCSHGNGDNCGDEEGLLETMVQVMKDHRTFRVREEVMQVVKSIANSKHRRRLIEAGMIPEVVQVLQQRTDSKTDQSVACEALGSLIDPSAPFGASAVDVSVQDEMAKDGVPATVMKSIDLAKRLVLPPGFGGQNEEALRQYDIHRSCFLTISVLAKGHAANQQELVNLGAPARIAEAMREHQTNVGLQVAGCRALAALSEGHQAAVEAANPPKCSVSFA